jgi:aryl-alcohol dehydrogenase-like predicted oxidoreductase
LTAESVATSQSTARVEIAPGYSIAKIINGCWQLSEGHGGNSDSEPEIFHRFHEQVEAGFTTFDCADIYTGVESLLGRFIQGEKLKDQVQIHTKYVPDLRLLPSLSRNDIESTIDRSLRRLGVEQLDLVQFHWWDYSIPGYLEALAVLDELRISGKIRLLGITNFDTVHVKEILDAGFPISTIQLQYSLLDRRPEKYMADLCQNHGVTMLCYGALAGGFLSDGHFKSDPPLNLNRSLTKYRLIIEEAGGWESFQGLLSSLRLIADEIQSSIATVAALWIMEQKSVGGLILGLGNKNRSQSSREMLQAGLSQGQLEAISKAIRNLAVPAGDVFELERQVSGPHSAIMKMNLNEVPTG